MLGVTVGVNITATGHETSVVGVVVDLTLAIGALLLMRSPWRELTR